MPRLADVQTQLRDALVTGEAAGILPLLIGGRDPGKRLAVHQRHYQASLVSALLTKFPATVWLMGADCVGEAARAFVQHHPPAAPCIAEFGETFPDFIASAPGAAAVPYLRDFAALEWRLGHAAVAIEHAAVALSSLSAYPPDTLPDLTLRLQPGVTYLRAGWPVDDVIRLYLQECAPDRYSIAPMDIRLEIRGARNTFQMVRLDPGTFVFRQAVQQGRAVGAAAELALDADAGFDPGEALTALMAEGLVTAVETTTTGTTP